LKPPSIPKILEGKNALAVTRLRVIAYMERNAKLQA